MIPRIGASVTRYGTAVLRQFELMGSFTPNSSDAIARARDKLRSHQLLAAQGIATGDIDVAVAGGMESMSNCPYLLPRVREGLRMGNGTIVDAMIHDGLWCAFENQHMGCAAEWVAGQLGDSALLVRYSKW